MSINSTFSFAAVPRKWIVESTSPYSQHATWPNPQIMNVAWLQFIFYVPGMTIQSLFGESSPRWKTSEVPPPVGSEWKPTSGRSTTCTPGFAPFLPCLGGWDCHDPEVNCFGSLTSFFPLKSQHVSKLNITPCSHWLNTNVCASDGSHDRFLFRRMGVGWVGRGQRKRILWMTQCRKSQRFWSFGRKEQNNKTLVDYILSVLSAEKLGSGPRNFALSPGVCFSSRGVGFSFDRSFPLFLSHSKLL